MNIAGIQKTTLVDYPGKVAATVFTRGCTFRCPFCHNPELVISEKFIPLFSEEEILDFLKTRIGKLQAVCITGGEPTIQSDIIKFIQKLKKMGFLVKLDSNGSLPEVLEKIIKAGDVDYIAMDIKASPEKYDLATGCHPELPSSLGCLAKTDVSGSLRCHSERSEESKDPSALPQDDTLIANIKKSISLIMNSGIDYEFRTTVCHPIHEVEDFEQIGKMIKGAKRYFIQNFVQSKHINEHQKFEPFTEEELARAEQTIQKYIKKVSIR